MKAALGRRTELARAVDVFDDHHAAGCEASREVRHRLLRPRKVRQQEPRVDDVEPLRRRHRREHILEAELDVAPPIRLPPRGARDRVSRRPRRHRQPSPEVRADPARASRRHHRSRRRGNAPRVARAAPATGASWATSPGRACGAVPGPAVRRESHSAGRWCSCTRYGRTRDPVRALVGTMGAAAPTDTHGCRT